MKCLLHSQHWCSIDTLCHTYDSDSASVTNSSRAVAYVGGGGGGGRYTGGKCTGGKCLRGGGLRGGTGGPQSDSFEAQNASSSSTAHEQSSDRTRAACLDQSLLWKGTPQLRPGLSRSSSDRVSPESRLSDF